MDNPIDLMNAAISGTGAASVLVCLMLVLAALVARVWREMRAASGLADQHAQLRKTLQDERDTAVKRADKINRERNEAVEQSAKLAAEYANATRRITELEATVSDLTAQVRALTEQTRLLTEQLRASTHQAEDLRDQLRMSDRYIAFLESQKG